MRSSRLTLTFLAFYLIFLGGSAYYNLIVPVRILHHLVMTGIVLYWIVRRLRGDGLPQTGINRPIYAAAIVWFITGVASIDSRMAFEHLWFVFLHVVVFFMLVDLFQRGRGKMVMETTFLMAALVLIITGLEVASWYFGLGVVPGTDVGWISAGLIPPELPRVGLALNISTLLAGFVAPLIPVTIAWALTVRRRDYQQVLLLVAVGLTITLFLTFSRGGLLSLAASLGTLALFYGLRSDHLRKISPSVIAGGLIAGGIVLLLIFTVSQTRSSGDEIRLDMYESAIDILADYPVTGVGPGIFGRAFRDYRSPSLARDKLASAHNAPLNTAAETGLLGIGVSLWIAVALARIWWRTWQAQDTPQRKLRHVAVLAALVGVGVHSLVDVFTVTPVVLVIILLLAYSVTGHRTVLDPPPTAVKPPLFVALIVTLAYAVFLLQGDRALISYMGSLQGGDDALEQAQRAASIDPYLNLYDLQVANLLGDEARSNEDATSIAAANAAYNHALELEPNWDTGWVNLAALYEIQGEPQAALDALTTATRINPLTTYTVPAARIAEENNLLAESDIIGTYVAGIVMNRRNNARLPTSDFWTQTPARLAAVEQYIDAVVPPVDIQYRIWQALDPPRAAAMVTDEATTAAQAWVNGQAAYTRGDMAEAEAYFTQVIDLRGSGDDYTSRARATAFDNPDGASDDLDMADRLGTRYEFPDAVRAQLPQFTDERTTLLATALPGIGQPQEFAAVLYGGRIADFDIPSSMRPPGPGREIMSPWYDLAQIRLDEGYPGEAARIYRAILRYAPDETEARQKLDELGA